MLVQLPGCCWWWQCSGWCLLLFLFCPSNWTGIELSCHHHHQHHPHRCLLHHSSFYNPPLRPSIYVLLTLTAQRSIATLPLAATQPTWPQQPTSSWTSAPFHSLHHSTTPHVTTTKMCVSWIWVPCTQWFLPPSASTSHVSLWPSSTTASYNTPRSTFLTSKWPPPPTLSSLRKTPQTPKSLPRNTTRIPTHTTSPPTPSVWPLRHSTRHRTTRPRLRWASSWAPFCCAGLPSSPSMLSTPSAGSLHARLRCTLNSFTEARTDLWK